MYVLQTVLEIEQTRMITVPWAREVELCHESSILIFLPGAGRHGQVWYRKFGTVKVRLRIL